MIRYGWQILSQINEIISKKDAIEYIISDLKREEVAGTFYEKELQKTNQQEFRVEQKNQGKKVINYMS